MKWWAAIAFIVAAVVSPEPVSASGSPYYCARIFNANTGAPATECSSGNLDAEPLPVNGWKFDANTALERAKARLEATVGSFGQWCSVDPNWPALRTQPGINQILSTANTGSFAAGGIAKYVASGNSCDNPLHVNERAISTFIGCRADAVECEDEDPAPEFCEEMSQNPPSNPGYVRFQVEDPFHFEVQLGSVYALNGCEVEITGASWCFGAAPTTGVSEMCTLSGRYTGEPAPSDPETVDVVQPEEAESVEGETVEVPEEADPECFMQAGVIMCGPTTHPASCGTINGERACVAVVNNDSCVLHASGAMSCFGVAELVDDEDNPVEADATVAHSDGQGGTIIRNYYTSETVNNVMNNGGGASGDVKPDSGDGTGGSGSGDGTEPEGDAGGIGDLSGRISDALGYQHGEECPVGENCVVGALDEAWDVFNLPEVGSAAEDCPRPEFAFFGQEYELGFFCDLFETSQVETFFFWLMGLIWGLLAIRIVLSA